MSELTYEDGYRAGLKFAITPTANGNQRKAVELGLMDVRANFATYGGPYICHSGYNLGDGAYRGGFIAKIEGAPGQERIDRTNYIANAINFHEPLVEALTAALATIEDYLAYKHNGDPWVEDARAMGEMDINDYATDGRLVAAKALLMSAAP